MATAWFVAPYNRKDISLNRPGRYCAMDDFTPQIIADGGGWAESEVLGNVAVVKVAASDATLSAIGSVTGFIRLPINSLTDTFSGVSAGTLKDLKNAAIAAGYTVPEFNGKIPNFASATLQQFLEFWAQRRQKPRYDSANDVIVCDGDVQSCVPITIVDFKIK